MKAFKTPLKLPKELAVSGGLLLFAAVLFAGDPGLDRGLCMMAMLLSSVGDVLLSDIGNLRKRIPRYFQIGAMAFAIAHIFYSAAYFVLLRKVPGWSGAGNVGTWIGILVMISLLCVITRLCVRQGRFKDLMLFVVYAFFIGMDFMIVLTYTGAAAGMQWRAAGAVIGVSAFLIY